MNKNIFSMVLLVSAAGVSAHLDTLFFPQTGANLSVGSTVTVHWEVGNNHNGITLELSTDDRTWIAVSPILGKSATTFNWKVPALNTTQARIRVCQVSSPGASCTDADTVNNYADGPTYWLVSGRFKIQSVTSVIGADPGRTQEVGIASLPRHATLGYSVRRKSHTDIAIVDLQGRILKEH